MNLSLEEMETKYCTACHRFLPLTSFGRKHDTYDGLMSRCKECNRARQKEIYQERRTAILAQKRVYYEQARYRINAYRQTPEAQVSHREHAKKYRQQRPEVMRAHNLVNRAVRRGEMAPPTQLPCAECGNLAAEYHHPDYSKPHDVIALCKDCHTGVHHAVSHT